MAVVFYSKVDRLDEWQAVMEKHLPEGIEFRPYDAIGDPAEVEFALAWKPPRGWLRQFPKLRYIFSLGAGVDHILEDTDLPDGVPVVRMIDHSLTQGMTEYIAQHVLNHHREQARLDASQRAAEWDFFAPPLAQDRRVGIMGLGTLGSAAARPLVELGFQVAGWSRSEKQVAGVESFHGSDGLDAFLARTEILACVLPHTPATDSILDAGLLAKLPKGASLINAGRGKLQVEEDILAALDSGQLSHATLDVFRTEPLPAESPLWRHPKLTVTPHNAAVTGADSAARTICDDIRRIRDGGQPQHIVDPKEGY